MKALSLFSGIGGIDLACEWAGIETVAFCEREPFPQKVLRKHWPDVPIYDDVCTLTKERLEADVIGTIDLIHGGYPCQPFSNAGNRKGTEDDRHLWPEYFRLVKELRPRWVVGENVAGHITLGLDIVLADLESEGYQTQAFVIPAVAVDARHRRDRVFIVGYAEHHGSYGAKVGRGTDSTSNDLPQRSEEACQPPGTGGRTDYEALAYSESVITGGLSIGTESPFTRPACSSKNVAHSPGERCGETRQHQSERTKEWTTGSSEVISDSTSPGLSIGGQSERNKSTTEIKAGMEPEFERRGEDVSHTHCAGYKEQHASSISDRSRQRTWGTPSGRKQWSVEPAVGRVANGVPSRVDRLKALGNAVVPQQIYPILAAIKQINDMMRTV